MAKTGLIFIFIYYFVMSVILFAMMGIDKAKAKKGAWRIPELTLFMLSAVGGALGGLLGMCVFHHKSRKWSFRIVFFASIVFHALLVSSFYRAIG